MATKIYRPKELADLLGVTRQTITAMCRRGQLKAIRAGNMWRIPFDIEEVDRIAEENKRTA